MTRAMIEAVGLRKSFGETHALAGLDFDVKEGKTSACSARMAPARPPRCASSPRSPVPTAAARQWPASTSSGTQPGCARIFAAVFPLTFVSSAFVPTATMPDWMRVFAENQPMTLVVNAVRDLTLGTSLYAAELPSVIWSVAILVVAFPLGLWLYNRRTTQ